MVLQIIQRMLLLNSAFFADDAIDYQKQVRHVFQERCFACHGALRQEGGLRVDTAAATIQGGDTGAAIVPKNVADSLLLARISATDLSERMPPEGEPLKPDEISAIRRWIEQGAVAPVDEVPEADPREHWAFKTPVRPVVPNVQNSAWVLNPIDAFIAYAQQKKGLSPQPAADRRIWLRRVSLDLTGLPPSMMEQETFLADESPEAWETVVNRLLESPQYGERWGRHWMDIWRYSDWWGLGAEVRNSQKHIWHWRDWIIESLNEDKAYDQMLREMLAADELYPNDPQKLRGTGFLARQYFKFNRTSWLDETVEHTSKAMLGLTVNCAKCHDHKYDPVTHVEYYQLRAIFEPYQVRTDAIPGQLDFEKDGIPRAFDCNLDAPTYLHLRGDDRNPDLSRPITATVPAFLTFTPFTVEPLSLPVEARQPGLRADVIETYLKEAQRRIQESRLALESAQQKLAKTELALAEKLAANPQASGTDEAAPEVLVSDNFATEQPDRWEQRGGQWRYENSRLIQSQVGTDRAALRLRQKPPTDFQTTLKYKPTGGNTWKSVGIRFDCVADDGDEVMVYLSSCVGGSKAQVSYRNKGAPAYPNEGAEQRAVNLNEPHELTIRVRGTLVNVIVDGQPSVAYRLPVERQPGLLELIAFDATAEFLSFSLTTLPDALPMVNPPGTSNDGPLPLEQQQLMVRIAEKTLAEAEAEPASISARATAERARLENPEAPATGELVTAAVRAERIVAAAKAEADLAKAELSVVQATPEKRAEMESQQTKAKAAAETSRQALEVPGTVFASLAGALKTLENNLETEDSRRKPFPATSTGRRTAFARWLTDPRHPLPARVAVNHLWARHFGRGLVPAVFDFGRKGSAPTHPELLDWLAVEFIEHGWSMKHMHRLIVLSNTYRMTSSSVGASENQLATDGDNRFYWRRNPVRMESQVVRDSLLSLAGDLDLTMGGPSIAVNDEKSQRRSLYFVHSHNEHQKFLSMFDDASVLECYRRAESIVPQQALALENSALVREMAEKITARIEAGQALSDLPQAAEVEFIQQAFRTVLASEPGEEELSVSQDALHQLETVGASSGTGSSGIDVARRARISFVQALLNHNDFVTVR